MTDISVEALAEAVVEKMRQEVHALGIYPESHARFVTELIIEREENRKRRERIKEKIAGSVILSAALLIIGLIGAGALDWIRKNIG